MDGYILLARGALKDSVSREGDEGLRQKKGWCNENQNVIGDDR